MRSTNAEFYDNTKRLYGVSPGDYNTLEGPASQPEFNLSISWKSFLMGPGNGWFQFPSLNFNIRQLSVEGSRYYRSPRRLLSILSAGAVRCCRRYIADKFRESVHRAVTGRILIASIALTILWKLLVRALDAVNTTSRRELFKNIGDYCRYSSRYSMRGLSMLFSIFSPTVIDAIDALGAFDDRANHALGESFRY